MNIPRWLRNALVVLTLFAVTTPALAACGSDEDDPVDPASFTNPTTGERCQPWVNNPHEADSSGLRACDTAISTVRPVQSPGMSAVDYLLLMHMFDFGMTYHRTYFSDGYYNRYIGPAWSAHPGNYYTYGHQPVTRITTINNFHTTVVDPVNSKYSAQMRTAEKGANYTTRSGKRYTGTSVPAKVFSDTNAPTKSGGNAGVVGRSPQPSRGSGRSVTPSGSGGKGGYSSPSSGGSRSSGGGGRR